uniref:Reverse transcriptase domain-containing protein n=1 Tax=Tanacetum cinerariifolium TaxID=118510 RepID=A0A6L2LKG3_TANCI|nr:hypothetical protein [Tanacetum cinerariifolium]
MDIYHVRNSLGCLGQTSRPERHESFTVHDAMVSRLTRRRVSYRSSDRHYSPDFTLDSPSSGSSLDSSSNTSSGSPLDSWLNTLSVHSLGFDASGQTHSGPSTRVASSSLVYPSVMTLRFSKAFSRLRYAPLSTPYPPKTSKPSPNSSFERSLDSFSLSAGPSRKRCRSHTPLVPSSTPVSRLMALTNADLLPPRKRFRYSYSPDDSREEHMEIGTTDAEAVADLEVEVEVDMRVGPIVDEDVLDHVTTDGAVEVTCDTLGDLVQRFHDHTEEILVHQIQVIKIAQRQLEASQLMASGERDRLLIGLGGIVMMLGGDLRDWSRLFRGLNVSSRKIVNQAESQSQNSNDGDNGNDGNGNGGNGNGNHGGGENNGNGNPNENGRGYMPVSRVCTYQDFVKCQLLNFKGTEGVVGQLELMLRFYDMERSYEVDDGSVLFKERDTKMETELWNLTVKNNDLAAYTKRQVNFKKDCPKLKNHNHGNMPITHEARRKAYAIGRGDANSRSNVVTCMFPLNNHYAFVLFDSGADRSFMSTDFSTLLDVIPDTLDVSYAVELADIRIAETNIVLRGLGIRIISDLDQTPDLSQQPPQNYPKCGCPVNGHYCQGYSSKPSNDNTNVVNALQEPFVIKQDPGKNSSQSPPQINHHCCYECGDPLEDIFCHQCTCELCGRGAHYGYNCPPKVPVVPDSKPFNNETVDEHPQSFPSFDPTCYFENGNSFTYDSTSNLVHDSPNVFNPPLQPLTYSYEFCGNDLIMVTIVHFKFFSPTIQNRYSGVIQRLHNDVQNIHEELAVHINTPNWDRPTNCYDDDDEDYAIAVTPSLSTEEPDNSLKSLVPIPSNSEGIPDNMCDVPFHDNSPPLNVSKDQFEGFSDSNDGSTSIDDDSFSIDNIEYVEASPPNFELLSSEVMEIVIPVVGGIDDDILLTIKDDILREKLLNSSFTSLNSLLEETNTFDNSLPEFETFYFDLEEISSVNTTTRSDISLPVYEAFYDDHVKEISSGSTTTHSDSSLYDSFIFDLSINPFPPADMSDFYEFADELAHIISPPEYDYFCFKIEPNSGDFTMDVMHDIFPTRESRVHNALHTHLTLQLNLDFILSSESLFTYVVWIFLPFHSYSVAPQYLLSFGNEDTNFDPGICSYCLFFNVGCISSEWNFYKIQSLE